EMHAARLAKVAANAGLQMSALAALEKMAPPPTATTVAGLLGITFLDHVVMVAALGGVGLLLGRWAGLPGVGLLAGIAAAVAVLARKHRRKRPRNVARDMLEVAAGVGEVTGVPLVLMGHSHHGSLDRLGEVVYANSGSWLDGSHLVVRRDAATRRFAAVELRRWRNGGVLTLHRMAVPQPNTPLPTELVASVVVPP
ncbi:MAG: hypothetical protein JNK45_31015, partial [Myxococcales bacterium]|nr:hypothetical protein [Myxococcales bacterium]